MCREGGHYGWSVEQPRFTDHPEARQFIVTVKVLLIM
jgi:hypothetical protein